MVKLSENATALRNQYAVDEFNFQKRSSLGSGEYQYGSKSLQENFTEFARLTLRNTYNSSSSNVERKRKTKRIWNRK